MIPYHVPYDDVFEDVAVVVRARRHFFCLSLALQRNIIHGVRGVPVKRNTRYVESKKVKILARLLDSPNLTYLSVKLLLPLLFTQQSPKQPSLKNSQMLKCSTFQLNQMTKMREGVWMNSFSFWTFTNIIKKQLETTSNISHNDKLIKIFPQEP